MPLAKVYVPAATLTPEQRGDIIKGIHKVINRVEKRPAGAHTYVLISEVPCGDWGSAGVAFNPQNR